jgi:hypothetical protein
MSPDPRKLKMDLNIGSIPKKTAKFATVTLDDVTPSGISPQILVRFATEPSDAERANLLGKFRELSPLQRYRGKLFYHFFLTWLRALASERCRDGSTIFAGCDKAVVDTNAFSIGALAAKSAPPDGLQEFATSIRY